MSETERQIAGRYQLNSRVGQGAMGVVWHGYDQQLHRVVAVKQLLVAEHDDEEKATRAKNRAMREARLAARLEHPNAIRVYDAVEDGGEPWLVMEYLSSRSLAAVIAETGPLPPHQVAAYGWQIASALAAAHRSGIQHRDVKPGNVLVGEQNEVKITDFGISRAVDDVTATATGTVGTPAFFSPEVARGDDAGFPSDVFSLGATLYNAVEGKPPFGYSDNSIQLLHKVASGEYLAPEQAGPLAPVLTRLLRRDPAERPTMDEAVTLLAGVAQTAPPKPKRRKVLLVAAAVLLVLAAGGGWYLWPKSPTTPLAGGTTSSQPSQTSQPPPAPTTQATTTTTTTAEAPPTAQQAITSYYAMIPGDLDTGWSKLTERFRQGRNLTLQSYKSWWGQMSGVELTDWAPQGDNVVSVNVTYRFANGGAQTERHTYTLVRQDGQWAIDNQVMG